MTTFERSIKDGNVCVHCGLPEARHSWRCCACKKTLARDANGLPGTLHTHDDVNRGWSPATLCCPDSVGHALEILAARPDPLTRIADTLDATLARWLAEDAKEAARREAMREQQRSGLTGQKLEWVQHGGYPCPYCERRDLRLLSRGNTIFGCERCVQIFLTENP